MAKVHPYKELSHAVALAMFEQWRLFHDFYLQTGVPPWSILLSASEKRSRFEDPVLRHEDIAQATSPEAVAVYYESRAKLEGQKR